MQIFRILALRVIRWHETSGDVGEKGPGKEEAKGGIPGKGMPGSRAEEGRGEGLGAPARSMQSRGS